MRRRRSTSSLRPGCRRPCGRARTRRSATSRRPRGRWPPGCLPPRRRRPRSSAAAARAPAAGAPPRRTARHPAATPSCARGGRGRPTGHSATTTRPSARAALGHGRGDVVGGRRRPRTRRPGRVKRPRRSAARASGSAKSSGIGCGAMDGQAGSISKLRSTAGAECVSAPIDT